MSTRPTKRVDVESLLRQRLITGQIRPDSRLSIRTLAAEFGVSAMPVREALGRLAADGALVIHEKKRIAVPPLTEERFEEIRLMRELVEPEAAVRALSAIGPTVMHKLKRFDAAIDLAMQTKDVERYMKANASFHFTLYNAHPQPVMQRLIETLWLQTGPFQGYVIHQWGVQNLRDQHEVALEAIQRRQSAKLKAAIKQDIRDGMRLIREHLMQGR